MDEPPQSRVRRVVRRVLGFGFVVCVLPIGLGIGIANVAATPAAAVGKLSPKAYDRGMRALRNGCWGDAEKYLRQVPPSHPGYGRAMLYCANRKQPRDGIVYVNRALWADPSDDEVWQGALRTYVRTLEDVLFGWLD